MTAFIEERLDRQARREIVKHAASCAQCRAVIGAEPQKWSARTLVAGAAVVAAVAIVVVIRPLRAPQIRDDGLNALIRASAELDYRVIEGRATGALAYRPHRSVMRGTAAAAPALISTAASLQKAAAQRGTAEDFHALGVAELLLGQSEEALAWLLRAVSSVGSEDDLLQMIGQSGDAKLLSDLAAALLHRSRLTGSAEDRLLAHEAAARAWKFQQSPEIAWNRALATQALHMRRDAVDAWQSYLRLDPGSQWAVEARARIRELSAPTPAEMWPDAKRRLLEAAESGDAAEVRKLVSSFPLQARLLAEDELLLRWAEASREGAEPAARRCVTQLRSIADAIYARNGDAFLRDAVAAIESMPRGRPTTAYLTYVYGRKAYLQGDYAAARSRLIEAGNGLAGLRSPFARLAGVYGATCVYYANDYGSAIAETRALLSAHGEWSRYPAAQARVLWVRGIALASLGRIDEAIADYDDARCLFSAAGEQESVVAIQELLASALEMIGDRDGSWNHRLAVLQVLGPGASRYPQTVAGAVRAAARQGFTATARLFNETEVAATAGHPEWRVSHVAALAQRARLEREEGNETAARAAVEAAMTTTAAIIDSGDRQFASTDPELVRARVLSLPPPERMRLVDAALAEATREGHHYRTVELLLLSATQAATAGDARSAIQRLDRAVALIEAQDAALRDHALRDALLDEYRHAYRLLIALLVDRGEPIAALLQAERSRARTLRRPAVGAVIDSEAELTAFRRALPHDTAVVLFAAVSDRIFAWVLRPEAVELVQIPLPRDARASLRTLVNGEATRFEQTASHVGSWLVEPWLAHAANAATVVFVPDELTADVPFNALGAAGELVVDRFRVIVSPSLALYVSSVDRDRRLRDASGRVVAVAALAARPDLRLAALPAGRREVEFLRGRGALVLDGLSATRRGLNEVARSASTLHITAHAFANAANPGFSAIVLQPADGDNGLLYSHEIAGMSLDATRLVVINACEAMQAGRRRREGLGSVARAFLAAGVPMVIGSSRPIDDSLAADMAVALHARIAAGLDPATALRDVQLSMKGRTRLVEWAALQLLGGVAGKEER